MVQQYQVMLLYYYPVGYIIFVWYLAYRTNHVAEVRFSHHLMLYARHVPDTGGR